MCCSPLFWLRSSQLKGQEVILFQTPLLIYSMFVISIISHLAPGFTLNSVFRQKCKGTTGSIEISSGHRDVQNSLTILFATAPIMQPPLPRALVKESQTSENAIKIRPGFH